MMLMPYRMETAFTRVPYSNAVLVAIISLVFFFIAFGLISEDAATSMVLQDWDLGQMIGSMFLHGGLFHLVGNMIFLWIFGNAVCATVGNGIYPILYLFLGLCASATHLMFDGRPALGASGAINGVVGMALVLFPVNRLKCWYAFFMPFAGIAWKSGTFITKTYWMVSAWVVFDVLGIIFGGGTTAHWAHVGGFVIGLVIAWALILFKVIDTVDPTLLDVITGRPLERTQYDLNELASMPVSPSVEEATPQKPIANSLLHRPGVKPAQPQTPPAVVKREAYPVLRVTNIVQKGSDLVIFFVNDGDPVRDISLATSEGASAFLQPTKQLARREMGTMRLANVDRQSLSALRMTIAYSDGYGRRNKQLVFDEAKQRFTVL